MDNYKYHKVHIFSDLEVHYQKSLNTTAILGTPEKKRTSVNNIRRCEYINSKDGLRHLDNHGMKNQTRYISLSLRELVLSTTLRSWQLVDLIRIRLICN